MNKMKAPINNQEPFSADISLIAQAQSYELIKNVKLKSGEGATGAN